MMKRLVFSILMILALTAGATYAQSTLNTSPPGPTQQQEPGLTNNNLPNPGNPVPTPQAEQPDQEQGTVEGTATESLNGTQGGNTTGDVTGTTTGTMDTTTGTATGTTTGTYTTGTTTTGTSTDLDTTTTTTTTRSEERRVGKECRSRWSPY